MADVLESEGILFAAAAYLVVSVWDHSGKVVGAVKSSRPFVRKSGVNDAKLYPILGRSGLRDLNLALEFQFFYDVPQIRQFALQSSRDRGFTYDERSLGDVRSGISDNSEAAIFE